MAALPPEYLHEPALALAAGEDGLDIVRRILADAPRHLKPGGLLAIEIGHNRDIFERAFPQLQPIWLASETSSDMILLLHREQLQ
jgi:ribosomal protein L3 glutamine methyltransferase